jgi:hypothetical protein
VLTNHKLSYSPNPSDAETVTPPKLHAAVRLVPFPFPVIRTVHLEYAAVYVVYPQQR